MGWNKTLKKMKAPVSTGDISEAVHYSSLDLGELITEGKINKWAKYKPVKHQELGFLNSVYNQRRTCDQGFVCGALADKIAITDLLRCFNNAIASEADWDYERPTGTIGVSPYRAFDFLNDEGHTSSSLYGYNELAKCPFNVAAPGSAYDPEVPAPENRADYYLMWQYTSEEISLIDFESFGTSYPSSWYWAVLYKTPNQSSSSDPEIAYLTTTKGGNTKIPVSAPDSQYPSIQGFFRIDTTPTMTGTVEACLALVRDTTPAKYMYVPTGKLISFEYTNPTAELIASWVYNTMPGQPSPAQEGIRFTITGDTSGTKISVKLKSRIKVQSPEVSASTRIVFRIAMQGLDGGVYGTVFYSTTEYTIDGTSWSETQYVDNTTPDPLHPLDICYTDGIDETAIDNVRISIQVTIGTQPSFYLDPRMVGDQSGRMGKIEASSDQFFTIAQIKQALGENVDYYVGVYWNA